MKVRRVDFAADEWLGGTLELTPYDRGIYITVCALIYSRGEQVGIELIRRHCGVHRNALNASLRRLAACGKLQLEMAEDGVNATSASCRRCVEELSASRLRMEKWAQNLPQSNKTIDLTSPPAHARARRTITKDKRRILDTDSVPARREDAPPSAAEIAEVDRLVAETLQAVKAKTGAPYVGKRDQWLNNLAAFVGTYFDGNARLEAWQAIEDARTAVTREATPKHIRKTLDDIDKLFRAATAAASYAEAAE